MRKAIFLFFLLLGIGIGFLSARHDGLGLQSIMMAVGAMFGGAIGGGLSQIGKRKLGGPELLGDEEIEPIPGGGLLIVISLRITGETKVSRPLRACRTLSQTSMCSTLIELAEVITFGVHLSQRFWLLLQVELHPRLPACQFAS